MSTPRRTFQSTGCGDLILAAANGYVLGHAPEEIRRLELQAKFLELPTRHVLDQISLEKGMRVLDIGTGSGDVAMLAAEYVGSIGQVIGLDRNSDVLVRARARAAHLSQVSFELGSLDGAERFGVFDLVIGRYVACFQEDDVAFLQSAARLVKPGGTVAFIEPAVAATREASQPTVALYDEMWNWVDKGFDAGGARVHMGNRCVQWFVQAGLGEPSLLYEMAIGGPSSSLVEWICLLVQSLAPALERAGFAKVEDFGFENLQTRLQEAVTAANSQIQAPPTVGAWARIGQA